MSARPFTILYISLVAFALAGLGLQHGLGLDILFYTFKPLPVLALVLFYGWMRKKAFNWRDGIMTAAIFCAFLGDGFLMYEGQQWFLLGLGSFFLTHLGYSVVFLDQRGGYLGKRWWIALLLIVYGISLVLVLRHFMEPELRTTLLLPVAAYAGVIILMALTAINRLYAVPPQSCHWVLLGSLLFVLSDSLIGINRFVLPLPTEGFIILATYYTAQYFIVLGYLDGLSAEEA